MHVDEAFVVAIATVFVAHGATRAFHNTENNRSIFRLFNIRVCYGTPYVVSVTNRNPKNLSITP
jgi:hypothetical protein